VTRKLAAVGLACAAGAALVAIVIYSAAHSSSREGISKVAIGPADDVYYTHSATREDAQALGQALRRTGFFNGRGTSVMLSKGTSGTVISFVLNEGAWDHPMTVFSFEEIARRVANSVGGFPLQVRLCDGKWGVRKEAVVGRVIAGTKDEVYYYGAATADEAEALEHALKKEKYLVDSGASVVLSKDKATSIGFVLGNGAWDRPGTVAAFETLARKVAPAVGGPPIDLHLLSPDMEIEKEIANVR
jgi:hypothetical protein